MRSLRKQAFWLFVLLAGLSLGAGSALAAGPELFQHGGRATAQVGAMTARADDPSAARYNPAGLGSLAGFQLQAGLDFNNPTDDFQGTGGTHRASHEIQFPPALYASWKPDPNSEWTYGLSLDTPYWYLRDWNTALFPGRFVTRKQELRVAELHPVVAYQLDPHWSVGGGLRYFYGSLQRGFNFQGQLPATATSPVQPFELQNLASARVTALSFDLAIRYAESAWGWGAVYRHGFKLSATDDFKIKIRDLVDTSRSDEVLARFPYDRARQSFELPPELLGGAWLAPYPELRLELDLSYQRWSSVGDSKLVVLPRSSAGGATPVDLSLKREWDDTLSIRLGVEGNLTDEIALTGGIAFEPSPVAKSTVEPGFPNGDTRVYALGASYSFPDLSFDLGYSLHQKQDVTVARSANLPPAAGGKFTGREQVWSFSARWRL